MWAQRLVAPASLEPVEVPDPDPDELAPGRVLLRTVAGGICGSDVPKFLAAPGGLPDGSPMHEIVGEVVASRHDAVAVGSLVVGWADQSNGLAELVETDGQQVLGLDPALGPPEAVVAQPLACVLSALERVPVRGQDVAIVGLGPIGLLFAHVVRDLGAATVVGVDPVPRQRQGATFGLDRVVSGFSGPWSDSLGADLPQVVIEAVGHQVGTFRDAVRATAPGGVVLYFGIPGRGSYPLDMEAFLRKNLTLVAGVARDRRRVLEQAVGYLVRHPRLADDLVTHRFGRGEIQPAYELSSVPAAERLKVVLDLQ